MTKVEAMRPAERDVLIITKQVELLDHTGHVNRGLKRAHALTLVAEINELRTVNGWKPLNMTGRWRRSCPASR